MEIDKPRCGWCLKDELYISYHDNEWGIPLYDDKRLFEFLILESFQAGLSWYTILKKRPNFEIAFLNFNPEKIAAMGEKDIQILMNNSGIIRNLQKIKATINNAQRFIDICEKNKSFSDYLWQFTDYKIKVNNFKSLNEIPAKTLESDRMSIQLKKDGFAFMGSTVCYAHMQATGMVNDHLLTCYKRF